MEISVAQRVHQQLTLTPGLRLALEILRMPLMELQTYLHQQLEENPLLELAEESMESTDPDRESPPSEEAALEPEFEELWRGAERPSTREESEESSRPDVAGRAPTLQEHLIRQLSGMGLDSVLLRAAETLLEWLDTNGYLPCPLEAISQEERIEPDLLAKGLVQIQRCDPPGVGARNLAECLLLQLNHRNQADGLAARIVRDHLDLLAKRRFQEMIRRLKVPAEELKKACRIIAQLDPKPARNFSAEPAPALIPDLILRPTRDGGYEVELNDEEIPRVALSSTYRGLLRRADTPGEAKVFIREKMRQGLWLLKAVRQRNATLLSIACCILEWEKEFLTDGAGGLRALTQEEVARKIGCHPSTVSRAIAGKTLQAPFGVIPLDHFFGGGIADPKGNGKRIAPQTIQAEIERLIASEDRGDPLSDQDLVKTLREGGFPVARRTVAKYRDQLRILPARLRRNLA